MKYLNTEIGFIEFPNEISLLINITNCPFHCKGCHSPELWEDIGTDLTQSELARLIEANKGITLVGFMGGNPFTVNSLAAYVKNNYNLKVGWYWGGETAPDGIGRHFDYIKVGPYNEKRGPLNNPFTNQRMYQITANNTIDITSKFWNNEQTQKEQNA